MASFQVAYKVTAGIEGGWNVDNGGQTYKGISRKGWPQWQGWAYIDRIIQRQGIPRHGSFFQDPVLDNMALSFYKTNYWDPLMGDYIRNQTVANFIFDYYVNDNGAVIQINRALGARESHKINEDSLKIINERPAFAYEVIRSIRVKHLQKRGSNPAFKKYAKGWMARLNKFPEKLSTYS